MDSTLKFLGDHCQPILTEGYAATHAPSKTAAGIYEVQTLLGYLSAIFDRHILREDEESAMQMISLKQGQSISSISSRQSSGISASDRGRVTSSFAFAFVWSFGGHLHERYPNKCNENSTCIFPAAFIFGHFISTLALMPFPHLLVFSIDKMNLFVILLFFCRSFVFYK